MNSKKLTEIKPYYVLPILFAGAILVNLAMSRPLAFGLTGFSSISLHANATADYSRDPLDLIFPVLDPDIMVDALQDQSGEPAPVGSSGESTPTPAIRATPTPTDRLVPPLPTNTLIDPILTAADPIVTLVDPIVTLVDDAGEILAPLTEPLDPILGDDCVVLFFVRICP